jgi:chemotaxis signal transduction protein
METLKLIERTGDFVGPKTMIEPVAESDQLLDDIAQTGETGESSQVLRRMCFRVGDLGLLVPFDAGREVTAPLTVSRVPNTVTWLRGLANVRGTLVPVIDAATAFGVARDAGTPAYLLIFGHGETAIGLLIDGLPRLLDIDISRPVLDRPDVPRLLDDSVIATYEHVDRIWLDVDLDILFDTLARHLVPASNDGANAQSGMNIQELDETRSAR